MAIYGAGPHAHGNMVSYALWMKTSSEEDMVLINTGRRGMRLQGLMNLHLNDGEPELLIAGQPLSQHVFGIDAVMKAVLARLDGAHHHRDGILSRISQRL